MQFLDEKNDSVLKASISEVNISNISSYQNTILDLNTEFKEILESWHVVETTHQKQFNTGACFSQTHKWELLT